MKSRARRGRGVGEQVVALAACTNSVDSGTGATMKQALVGVESAGVIKRVGYGWGQ